MYYSSFIYTSFHPSSFLFFFFNDTATTEIYTLSLHDALPISNQNSNYQCEHDEHGRENLPAPCPIHEFFHLLSHVYNPFILRSEEHTSELQSQSNLVCRLLLEKKKHQE